jgi:hypothetical protein
MIVAIVLSAVALILLGGLIFVSKELLKKFKIHEKFTARSGYRWKEKIHWYGNKKGKMGNVVLRGKSEFSFLAEFNFPIGGGIDFFGTGEAKRVNNHFETVVSTFLWDPIDLLFEISSPQKQEIEISFGPDNLVPDYVYNPHFFQRIHIGS